MERRQNVRRIIASYVSPHAYAPRTRAALVGLGYHVVAATTRGRFDDDRWKPDLRIVDDRHFDKLPVEDYVPRTPIIVLCGARRRQWRDARVIGEASRPAGLAEIYPLIQDALEDTPRRAARARTQLPARCSHAERRCVGAIVSLSAAGCLFRTRAEMEPGMRCNLLFPLPREQMVYTRARVLHRSDEGFGMDFSNPTEQSRRAIAEFVTERLATSRI